MRLSTYVIRNLGTDGKDFRELSAIKYTKHYEFAKKKNKMNKKTL